ncbi:peptidylprolyl isomerase [Marinilabiliaceae bacterium ANBcel2]|nr:peptidylprolyl isomerase [Marinilabiliaceae bacterium ANBcel2]
MQKQIKALTILFLISLLITACKTSSNSNDSSQTDKETQVLRGSYNTNIKAVVELQTYDRYTRRINNGIGFYVDERTIITNYDLIQGAYRVRASSPGSHSRTNISGYTAYDLKNNLITLRTNSSNNDFLKVEPPIFDTDSLYSLYKEGDNLMIRRYLSAKKIDNDSAIWYNLKRETPVGNPLFYKDHGLAGIIQKKENDDGTTLYYAQNNSLIIDLLNKREDVNDIINLSDKSNRVYPSYKDIKGFNIITDMGNIEIKLYNETPKYRDNFIRLVSDNYYDNLMIHRVIRSFLIQTGAADTREEVPSDEMVGWQGPGHTIPMNIVPGLFHKRGAIAASKLPDAYNPRNESDGGQFYMISGRVFRDKELDELEEQKGITFTKEQREVYTTIGGAPHLDNDYTVFGEVVKGMELVDEISLMETNNKERPKKDIRIKTIEIIKH